MNVPIKNACTQYVILHAKLSNLYSASYVKTVICKHTYKMPPSCLRTDDSSKYRIVSRRIISLLTIHNKGHDGFSVPAVVTHTECLIIHSRIDRLPLFNGRGLVFSILSIYYQNWNTCGQTNIMLVFASYIMFDEHK